MADPHVLTLDRDADSWLAWCSCGRWSYAAPDYPAAIDAHRAHRRQEQPDG